MIAIKIPIPDEDCKDEQPNPAMKNDAIRNTNIVVI